MIKNRHITLSLVALLTLAGCNKAENFHNEESDGNSYSFTVTTANNDTSPSALARTQLGELIEGKRDVYWSEGDCIAINGNSSEPLSGVGESAKIGTFNFTESQTAPYNVLYPAALYKDATTITLPAKQYPAEGNIDSNVLPLCHYAEQHTNNLTMHHAAAVLRLSITTDEAYSYTSSHFPIIRVLFKGNDNEQVSGDFTIDYANCTLSSTSTATADRQLAAQTNSTLTEGTTTDIFLVVPARTYEKGFTIHLINSQWHWMDVVSNRRQELAAGDILAMPTVGYNPTYVQIDPSI